MCRMELGQKMEGDGEVSSDQEDDHSLDFGGLAPVAVPTAYLQRSDIQVYTYRLVAQRKAHLGFLCVDTG